MAETIGYLGLGDIGLPMAERVRQAGFTLAVWNRSQDKMAPLLERGARAAASPADLARQCDIVLTCVTDGKALDAVTFGSDGLAAGAAGGRMTLLVDNSSTLPAAARAIGERLRALGIAFVDAPVSGGVAGAAAGTLAVMAGGERADVERARPVLMSFANRVTHMGPSGAGQATKSCNQVINFAAFMGIAEALNLGRHFGIDVARLPDAIAGGLADSNMLREYHRAATTGENPGIAFLINGLADFYGGHMNPQLRGRLDLLVKDIGVALQLGHETGAAMPLMGMLDAYARILNAEEKS